jgi:hypothetical protein
MFAVSGSGQKGSKWLTQTQKRGPGCSQALNIRGSCHFRFGLLHAYQMHAYQMSHIFINFLFIFT